MVIAVDWTVPGRKVIILSVIRRLYVHNFRCLQNFELKPGELTSLLLIGKNGSGKSTVGAALEILQRVGRGTSHVKSLFAPGDSGLSGADMPVTLEVEALIGEATFSYQLTLDRADPFGHRTVWEERLLLNGVPFFTREQLSIDKSLVALPLLQEGSPSEPISKFRNWLRQILIIRPIPSLSVGESREGTLFPDPSVRNFGEWFSGLVRQAPKAYGLILDYQKVVLPDLSEIRSPQVGQNAYSLEI